MNLGDVTDIAVSALQAQRVRMATGASNIANAETTRTEEGGPYRRRDPVFRATRMPAEGFPSRFDAALRQVTVPRVVQDDAEPIRRFLPGHPDAGPDGMVAFPRVNVVEELANVMAASRSYEANLAVMRKVRAMGEATMRIGR
jgi:flagellar basal-body rod protein FlgC